MTEMRFIDVLLESKLDQMMMGMSASSQIRQRPYFLVDLPQRLFLHNNAIC